MERNQKAELLKLAATLNIPSARVEPLTALAADEIRDLRRHYQAAVKRRFRPVSKQLALSCRFLPKALCARLAEYVFGPQLSAHVASQLKPAYVSDIGKRLSAEFLAEVMHYLDAESAVSLLEKLEQAQLKQILQGMIDNRYFAILAEILEVLPAKTQQDWLHHFNEPVAVLKTARFLSDPQDANAVLTELNEQQFADLLCDDSDLELVMLTLDQLATLSSSRQQKIARLLKSIGSHGTEVAAIARRHDRSAELAAFINML